MPRNPGLTDGAPSALTALSGNPTVEIVLKKDGANSHSRLDSQVREIPILRGSGVSRGGLFSILLRSIGGVGGGLPDIWQGNSGAGGGGLWVFINPAKEGRVATVTRSGA